MRNKQEFEDRDYRDRYNDERSRHPEHLQDARNRWGEPEPYMRPQNNDHNRFEQERNQHENYNRYENWAPFEQRDNRHFQEPRQHYYSNQQQNWQHRNESYGRQNQHASDRWDPEGEMPHQHHHPRHASEQFYREHRRRNW